MAELDPGSAKPPAEKLDFLATGHYLQTQVEDILKEEGIALVDTECEGIHDFGDFTIVGHVDGVIDNQGEGETPYSLLEVKAVQDKNFKALAKTNDWREKYEYNVPQAQTYLHFDELVSVSGDVRYSGPFGCTYFVYFNRNTSEMLGGLPIDRAGYTYRPDMVLYPDNGAFEEIRQRHVNALQYIDDKNVPDWCDKEGLCFFCGRGFPKLSPRGKMENYGR